MKNPTLKPYTLPSRSKSRHTNQNLSKSMSAQTHGKIADPNKTKNSAMNERKCLIMNKAQHLTMYIKHLADSANFEVVASNKTCSSLTGQSFEIPHYAYSSRCPMPSRPKKRRQKDQEIIITFKL